MTAPVGSERDRDALRSFARRIDPSDAGAHNNLGNALASLGRTEEAVVAFKKAIELTPARADLHSNLGNSLLRLHRYDEALASCSASVEAKAGCPW